MDLKKHIALTIILSLILLFNHKGFSALDITVKNRAGKSAIANVQIFPGEISPDSDKQPVPPPGRRADGLVGFQTNAAGKVSVNLPPGDYTVAAFSAMDEHRFSLVKQAVAPGSVELSAENASAITIFATDDDGAPLEGANIFFRPSRRVRGFVGSIDNDGYRLAYVSPGTYHTVLISTLDWYYLVLPHQKVDAPGTKVNIEAANLATAKVDFDLPPGHALAVYEVLETDLTYERIETIEQEIGYDATHTKEFAIISGIATLSANLTYQLNIEFVDDSFYAYEIHPLPILLEAGTYHIGSAGDEKFDLEISFDKPKYHPGETINVSYVVVDNRKNSLHRLFDYSGARLVFPFVTVRNPAGVQIASNPHTENFSAFSFNLPPSANVGEYSLQIYLDAPLYGKITKTLTFDVVAHPDERPKITQIAVPQEAEAGAEIIFSADIEDDKAIDTITLMLAHENGRKKSFPGPANQQKAHFRATIPAEFVVPGELNWDVLVKDTAGNETTASGQILIRDTTAPVIEPKPIATVEIGVDIILKARITDNACVSDAVLSYKVNQGNLQTVKLARADLQYRATIPAVEQFGTISYAVYATDAAGNAGYFPGPETFAAVQIADTTPPMIYHSPFTTYHAPLTLLIDAVVEDNNSIAEVKLHYQAPGAKEFQESLMSLNRNVYQATIPAVDFPNGVEYFIEAVDQSDLKGNRRKTKAPVGGTYLIQPPEILPLEVELLPRSSPESPLEIEVGTSQPFTLQDKAGNPVPIKVIWTSTGAPGHIDQTGLFTAEGKIRGDEAGRVIATLTWLDETNNPWQATAYVKLKPGKPHRLALVPQLARVAAGKSQYFHAVLMDNFDNEIAVGTQGLAPLQWLVSGNIGEIDDGIFTAEKVGLGAVEVHFGNLAALSEVQVDMGKIVRVDIAPKEAQIRAGQEQKFTALGYDAMDNPISIAPIWIVQGGIGIIEHGMFTGGKAGEGKVIAILGNLQSSAPVTVSPGELNSIDVVPFIDYLPSSIKKQYRRQFAVFGWDAGGNPTPIKNLRWNTDAAAGTIDETGLFTSTDGRDNIIGNIVTNGSVFAFGKSDSGGGFHDKSVVVIQYQPPEAPKKIAIYIENFGMELDKITMSVGESDRLEVTGFDKQGRRMSAAGGVANWEVLGDVGFITPAGIFTATRPGVGEIVATDGGFTAQITVAVTPGRLKTLVIKPEILTLNAGDSHQLTAYGYDEYGNSRPYDALQWLLSSEVAAITEGKVTAQRPGAASIMAKSGNIEGYAQLFVQPGSLHHLDISVQRQTPACSENVESAPSQPIFMTPGERGQCRVKGYDIAGNELTVMPNWHVSGGVGEIAFDGSFIATAAGEGVVTACVGNICAAKKVLVIQHSACPLRQGLAQRGCLQPSISPNPLNLIASASQQFVAWGMENPSWRIIGAIGVIDEPSGYFTAGEQPGTGYVVATSGGNIATASVAVYDEARMTALFIIPPAKQLKLRLNERQQFQALALTDENRLLWVLPTFSATNTIGTVDAKGNFTAHRIGEGSVVATFGSLQASCPLGVTSDVPTQAGIISRHAGHFELELTDDAQNNIIPQEVTWLLSDKTPPAQGAAAATYHDEYIEPQLATLGEPFYALTAIAKTDGKTVIASNFYPSPGKTSPAVINIFPPAIRVRAGETSRIVAIASDANGNLIPINPTWTLKSIGNVDKISDNGLFTGNRQGVGTITVSLSDRPLLPSSDVAIEVVPNRPAFALLQPDTVILPPTGRTERRFEFFAFDARNNPVEIAADQIQWKLIGEVGAVDKAGNFTPRVENKEEEIGELTAFIPADNLFARAQIRLLARQNAAREIRIEPAQIDLIRGQTHRFRAILLDYRDSVLPSGTRPIDWTVLKDNGGELEGAITSEGVLKSTGATIGEQLRVRAQTDSGILPTEALVNIVVGPLDTIEVTNLSDVSQIEVGEVIDLSASGLDAYGNNVDIHPRWWAPNGKVTPTSNNQAVFVATEPGDVTILAEQDGIVGKTAVSVVAPEEVDIRITALAADENAGQKPNEPVRMAAGSTILLAAYNRGEIISTPNWISSLPTGVISASGRFSANQADKYRITATFANKSADFFVEVTPCKLAAIQVTPPVVSVLTREKQQFYASGFDALGNELPEQKFRWDVTGGIGTIDETGSFSPTKTPVGTAVHGTVIAAPSFEDSAASTPALPSGSASVTVVSKLGPPVIISLQAEPLVVPAGGESIFTIAGADEDGNPITNFQDYPVKFLLSPGVGKVIVLTARWVYQSPEKLPAVRDITLKAQTQVSGKSLTAEVILSLVPAPLAGLSIEPKSVALSAGAGQRFELSAFDVFSNPIVLEETAWRLSKPLGKLSDQQPDSVTYMAQKAGSEELIAEGDNHIATTATIQITPGSPVRLSIEPPSAIITAGAEQEFAVIGFDYYDNRMGNPPLPPLEKGGTGEILWRLEDAQIGHLRPVPDKPASTRLLTSKAGESVLTVRYDEPETGKALTAQASVKVTPGRLKHLHIQAVGEHQETPFKLISGGEYIFKAQATDEYGNELFPPVAWKLLGDIGLLQDANGIVLLPADESQCILLAATFVGAGSLIATASDQSAEVRVEVTPLSEKIGREGGLIESPTNASISIPSGALKDETGISIAIIKPPSTVAITQRISDVIDFQPRGLTFRKPVKLTLSYEKSKIEGMENESSKLSLYFWDAFQEKWVRSGGRAENQSVTAYVNHLAPFAIMESPATPQTAKPLDILYVRLTPEVFYAPENNRLTIEYSLAMNNANRAEVTIKIYDFLGRLIATPLKAQPRDAGKHAEQWDGADENGKHVRNGRYVVVVIAKANDDTVAKKKLLVVFK